MTLTLTLNPNPNPKQADLTRTFASHMMAQKRALANYEADQEAIRAEQLAKVGLGPGSGLGLGLALTLTPTYP